MLTKNIIKKWEDGIYTDYGVYEACDTDIEFYNFLKSQGYDEHRIKETMLYVSGADDAYNNAILEREMKVRVTVNFSGLIEKEVSFDITLSGFDLNDIDDIDDDEAIGCLLDDIVQDEITERLDIDFVTWERIE